VKWAWPFRIRGRNGKDNGKKSSARSAGPDFLCVGAHKAGSTWLYQQLDSHPDFWMPPVKELHYFDQLSRVQRAGHPRCRDERDSRFLEQLENLSAEPGINIKEYGRLFESMTTLLSGDISPNYSTLASELIRQIAGYFPKLKVIYLARDPVERLWSHLSMEVHYAQIQPFDATNVNEVDRNLSRRGMLLRSYPSTVVARWKRHVHAKQFRVYFFDDLQRDPAALRRSIVRFLGADPEKPSNRSTEDYNSWNRMEKLPLTNEVRSHLAQFFKKELKTCAARLGGPAKNWPARYGF
jgi:hypothetical protein